MEFDDIVGISQSLPQEIFDNILGQLHNDTATLRECALVSPAWLATARVALFHRISLDPPKNPTNRKKAFFSRRGETPLTPCAKLFNTISFNLAQIAHEGRKDDTPIAHYIREIRLIEGMLFREWLAHEDKLPHLLRLLPNLRRFEIGRSASMSTPWAGLPGSLKDAIQGHVFALPSLSEVKLSSLMFESVKCVHFMLASCKRLRILELDHITFKSGSARCLDGERKTVEIDKAQLDTLLIGPRTSTLLIDMLLHPASAIALGAIRKLSMSISGDFAEFAKLLHASISVEQLEIVLMNDTDLQEYWKLPPSQQFDLTQVAHLRTLRINIDVLQKMDDPLPWVRAIVQSGVDTLRGNARPNMMQKIHIVYALYLPAPYMDRSVNTTIFECWTDIDAVLCGHEPGTEYDAEQEPKWHTYDNLEQVTLDFMLENPIGFGVAPRFLKEVVIDSPWLEEKRFLKINAFDTSK
ncbi:hypothetical protein CVT24_008596 [Panaeolus cyanescens]|uniref:F-box domain-containing protein n=1 Tax=Panaeolus cyanescens TaxID=181874 RepID=A0A409VEE3_9AGAR|nr:hypothetical protein CVT24_008596 [Panaeolus cyanescens]